MIIWTDKSFCHFIKLKKVIKIHDLYHKIKAHYQFDRILTFVNSFTKSKQ
jgi:hypothetical protein